MLSVGIAIAKRAPAATIVDATGSQRAPSLTFANTVEGVQALLERVKGDQQPVSFALEATGHDWLARDERLTSSGHAVAVFNPLQTDADRKSFLRTAKTDTRDSWVIADLVRIGRGQATVIPDQQVLQLRELGRFRFSLIDQIADLKRKVLSILERVFPEYERLFSDVFRKSSRAIRAPAATAEELAQFDLAELSARLGAASRGCFGEAKAREVKSAAARSWGVSFLAAACPIELRCLLGHLELLESPGALGDEHLARLLAGVPDGQHLVRMKGIGAALAAAIRGEIGDVSRFAGPEKLVASAGLDPSVSQTGGFVAAEARLGKRGSPSQESMLTPPAVSPIIGVAGFLGLLTEGAVMRSQMVFLLANLALAFYNVGIIWAHEVDIFRTWKLLDPATFRVVQSAHWKKLPYWVFAPVALSLAGSIALIWYHPPGSPAWAIWGNLICQLLSHVLTGAMWGRWQAALSTDPRGPQGPYLAKILRTHWIRTVLINTYAVILFAWVVQISIRQA